MGGDTGIGQKGEKGDTGGKGEKGNDGTGLTLKTFNEGDTYHHGDYVFAPSSKDPNHNSMYIATKTFKATLNPDKQLDGNHWVELMHLKVNKVKKVKKVIRVLDKKVKKATLVPKVRKVILVIQVPKVIKVRKVKKVMMVLD